MSLVGTRAAAEPALLEREDALATLDDALNAGTRSRQGRVVFVAGEAGAGKTALLQRFCEAVAPAIDVRSAGCEALFTPRPLGPLLDLAGERAQEAFEGATPHDV